MTRSIKEFIPVLAEILAEATEPLDSPRIREKAALRGLDVPIEVVSGWLFQLIRRMRPPFPLKRMPHPTRGPSRWAYYNPTVIQPLSLAAPPPAVNAVNSQQAQPPFDPIAFAQETMPEDIPQVTIPDGVRAIQITVAGVNIRIELTS